MQVGGIVLCGGKSSRMGLPKATLPFGSELMIQRVLRLLGEVVHPIAVVAAPRQHLPELPADVLIARDQREGRGPLEGLLAGLAAIQSQADAAYVTSCDVPLLVPSFVRKMIDALEDHDVAVPVEGTWFHPLAAIYRMRVLPLVKELLAEDSMRLVSLLEKVKTRQVPVEDLKAVDPELTTLLNLNRPDHYLDALARVGFEPPENFADRLK